MKAESWTVLLLFLAIIAISIWIYVLSTTELKENFAVQPYSEDSIPIQLVDGNLSGKPDPSACIRISKYGLVCDLNENTDGIDIFSNAKGDVGSTNSSGLHNSLGPLSLTPEMVDLLTTRGNNATGSSSIAGGTVTAYSA